MGRCEPDARRIRPVRLVPATQPWLVRTMMPAARAIGWLSFVLAAGCAGIPASSPDVPDLRARLRDTPVVGVFTKLALRNEAEDLLQQFRGHYRGGQGTSIDFLRQRYNILVLKVLALVQDGDPALARAISGAREAFWGILADPEKFDSAI